MKSKPRCQWAESDKLLVKYHDEEWGVPVHDDLFEGDEQWVSPDEFRRNLEKIVTLLRPLADTIVLVGNPACDESRTTPVSWGDFTYTNCELERSERIIGEVTKAHELVYVPSFHEFKQRLDADEVLLEDGLRPNNAGHEVIYELVQSRLLEILV